MVRIWLLSSFDSFVVTDAAITGLVTLQARPNAALEGTYTYGTFCKNGQIVVQLIAQTELLPCPRTKGAGVGGFQWARCPQSI